MDIAWTYSIIPLMFGACFGSFNTLLVYRLPRSIPIGLSRSACTSCGNTLGVLHLVPIVSWLCMRGRCGYCGAKISWYYPAIEITTALSFLLVYHFYGLSWQAVCIALFASQIVVLCIIDIEHRIIPDILQVTMAITGIAYAMTSSLHIADIIAGIFLATSVGLLLQYSFRYLCRKEALGTGDVKFMAVAGIWLGASPLPAFFFYSGIIGVASAVLWKCFHSDPRFPFGPALALSAFLLVLIPDTSHGLVWLSLQFITALNLI